MRLGVRLLDEASPELLRARDRGAAAEGELRVKSERLAPGLRGHRQLVVDPDGAPRTIEEKAHAAQAGRVARRVGRKEPRDQVVPLRDDGERTHEPAVAHTTLAQILGTEAVVRDDPQLRWQSSPRELRGRSATAKGDLAAVRPCKEAAPAKRAVPVPAALVGRVLGHDGGSGRSTAPARRRRAGLTRRRMRRSVGKRHLVLALDGQLRGWEVLVDKLLSRSGEPAHLLLVLCAIFVRQRAVVADEHRARTRVGGEPGALGRGKHLRSVAAPVRVSLTCEGEPACKKGERVRSRWSGRTLARFYSGCVNWLLILGRLLGIYGGHAGWC